MEGVLPEAGKTSMTTGACGKDPLWQIVTSRGVDGEKPVAAGTGGLNLPANITVQRGHVT